MLERRSREEERLCQRTESDCEPCLARGLQESRRLSRHTILSDLPGGKADAGSEKRVARGEERSTHSLAPWV